MTRVAAIIGHQRSGTHFLGAMLSSHPDIKYTGEIFANREPKSWKQLKEWVDRVIYGGFEVVLLDCKYNQISRYVEFLLERDEVVVIQNQRDDRLAQYYSGELHTWRGVNPDAPLSVRPTFEFNRQQFDEIHQEISDFEQRFQNLPNLRICYEDMTENKNTLELSRAISEALCTVLGVKNRLLTLPASHSKEAPSKYLDYLVGVPNSLRFRYGGSEWLEDLERPEGI